MPRAEIATRKHTLQQLHSELAGKILDNKAEADRLAVRNLLAWPHEGQHIRTHATPEVVRG